VRLGIGAPRSMKIARVLLLVLFVSAPAAAQELPPDTLADELLIGASEALESGDPDEALRIFREIEALYAEPAPDFAFLYGMTLVRHGAGAGDLRKGRTLFTEYVMAAGWESERYTQALELLLAAQAKLDAAEARDRLEERLPDIREAVNAQMIRVEGGSFTMGCTPEQDVCHADERLPRIVRVSTFEFGAYEVTQELWQTVMGENPSAFANCAHCPVETVSWDDIQAFLDRLNSGGGSYRLPSEAEWEYASRGGQLSEGYQYAGGDDWAEVAWIYANADNRTHPVGQKKPNELGLFDMSGNVREWVQDCWHGSYAGAPDDGRAWEEEGCDRRVIRSGSWYGKPSYVRSANRFWYTANFRNNNMGFRIVRSLQE